MHTDLRTPSRLAWIPPLTGAGAAVIGISIGGHEKTLEAPFWSPVASGLIHLGIGTLVVTALCSLLGAFALATRRVVETPGPGSAAGFPWKSISKAGALVTASLVAAALLWGMALSQTHRRIYGVGGEPLGAAPLRPWSHTVLVHNATPERFDRARLFGCGHDVDLGTLQPGEWSVHTLPIRQGGKIEFSTQGPKGARAVTVVEVLSRSQIDRTTVRLQSGGRISLEPGEVW